MRSTVSVTHADTLRKRKKKKKKRQMNTYVATQKHVRFKKQTVQVGHLALLPDRHEPTFLTHHSV
jgi:predicted nucleic acid-binding protein